MSDPGQEMCLAMAQGLHLCSEHDNRICFIWTLKEIKYVDTYKVFRTGAGTSFAE